MFLSYCLKYAGIPQSAIPQEASVLALRSSMSDMDWLLDGEDGSAANVGDIVIYNKYVTRTVAVDSSADGAADGLDDLFSMDAEGENGAELETSGASALDAAPAADSVITPDLPDTANPEQPAAKPADSTGTSASGADTLIPSVSSPAAEPQTTTVTDAQPVETVGIVSETDENTLTVISGDVDGKVAEVTLSNAEVLAVVDVAAAQYADEMLTTAVTGALQAPGMLMLAGAEETASTTASASIKTALDGAPYITVFKLQKEKNKQYVDVDTSVITDQLHGYLELKDIPALKIQEHEYQVVVSLPLEFDLKDVGTHKGNLTNPNYEGACGTYEFVQGEDGRWYALLTYEKDFIHQEELSEASKVDSTLGFDFKWNQEIVTTNGENKFSFNDDATVTITIKEDESTKPGEQKKYSLDKKSSGLKYDGKDAYINYTVTLKLNEAMAAPLTLTDILKNPDGYPLFKYDGDITVTGPDGSTPSISWKDPPMVDGGKEYDGKIITLGTAGTYLNPGTYTITYRVKAENFGTASYPDEDVRNYIKFEKDSKGTATSIKTREIEKKGELDKDGRTIKWTVTINRDSVRRYLPEGTTFTDAILEGQEFVKGSFKVEKKDENNKKSSPNADNVYDESTRTLTYTLDAGFNYYKITYKTKVTGDIPLNGLNVSNTGKVEGDGLHGSDEGTVHIGSNVLAKEAVGTPSNDGTTATLQWKSTINAEDVRTYVYYDYSGTFYDNTSKKHYKAQEIDLDSIKVKDKNGTDVTSSVKITEWTDSGKSDDYKVDLGLFKIDFTQSTPKVTGPLTITYTTKVTIASLPGSSADVVNSCYINNGSTVSDSQKVNKASDTIKYFYKCAGNVDWGKVQQGSDKTTLQPGQKLPWTIAINDNDVLKWIEDDEWVITDTIPKGLVLDENSIKISCNSSTPSTDSYKVEVTKETNGTTKLVITMQPEAFSYTSGNTKKIYKRIYITYDTTLDTTCHDIWDENNTAEFKNVAEFKRKGEKIGDTEFTETVTRDVVGKSGTFDAATGLLTYQVKVNPYGATLNGGNEMLLEDVMTIPEGLYGYVTLEGITVFDGELQADGSLEATGVPTDLTLASTDKKLDNGIAKRTVTTSTYYSKIEDTKKLMTWTKVADGKALVLVFHYRVDTTHLVANNTYTFKNKAKLNDHWTYEDKNTSFTSSSDASANINYNNSRLTIVKYSGTTNNVLPGATFSLEKYDGTQWVKVKDYTTSDNGNATIGGLDSDTLYRLLETAAPAGYLLPSPNNYYYFAISKQNSYTPPATSGITTIDKLYQLEADQKVGSFFYYCNNTPDETYVVPGKLKVVKKWTDASGNALTDLTKVPDVKVTLTKSAPAKGNTIYLAKNDGSDPIEYYSNIADGADIYIGRGGLSKTDMEGFFPGTTVTPIDKYVPGSNWNLLYKIGPINSDITINNSNLYYSHGNNPIVGQKGGNTSAEPVVTTVGTVTLNALNKWTHTWDELETGEGITYSITEETVTGYKTTYTVTVNGTESTDTSATAIPIDTAKGTLVTITNTEDTPGYELPSTGGTGTLPYTAVGGTMMLSALAYSFIHRKRRREGRADD